ncbi:MAG: outer membrane beta-barrel protein [Proteobacteria bacterium]|nr:outer membrane beta-barrel protein [Pseudomonadota bacterium]
MFNNKHRNLYFHHFILLLCLAFLFIQSPTLLAVCGLDEDDDYYGNAETCPFKNAVEGTEELTPKDIAFLNAVNATRIINRWYMRFFIGQPKVKLSELENEAVGAFNGITMPVTSVSENLLQATLAGGYFWEQWALELELYFSKELDFTLSPVYTDVPISAATTLNQAAAFVNVQYVIPRLFSWYPRRLQIHFDAGLGAALKMANLSLSSAINGTPFQSSSTRTFTGAANLGIGARYQITAHILVDVAYRYFFMGKTNFGPADVVSPMFDVQFTSEKLQSNGWFIGAVYQF